MHSISRDAGRLERMEDEVRDKVESQETIIAAPFADSSPFSALLTSYRPRY
jgi:hypothetical protein